MARCWVLREWAHAGTSVLVFTLRASFTLAGAFGCWCVVGVGCGLQIYRFGLSGLGLVSGVGSVAARSLRTVQWTRASLYLCNFVLCCESF
jgi:hypothetical protein